MFIWWFCMQSLNFALLNEIDHSMIGMTSKIKSLVVKYTYHPNCRPHGTCRYPMTFLIACACMKRLPGIAFWGAKGPKVKGHFPLFVNFSTTNVDFLQYSAALFPVGSRILHILSTFKTDPMPNPCAKIAFLIYPWGRTSPYCSSSIWHCLQM